MNTEIALLIGVTVGSLVTGLVLSVIYIRWYMRDMREIVDSYIGAEKALLEMQRRYESSETRRKGMEKVWEGRLLESENRRKEIETMLQEFLPITTTYELIGPKK